LTSYIIDFEPIGRRGKCRSGETILDCAHRLGVGINNICGGQGTCHSCKVQLLEGTVTDPTANELEAFSREELNDGWHLACQTHPYSNCKWSIPAESMTTSQRVQVEGLETKCQLKALVTAYHLKLPAPSLSDSQDDAGRILTALNKKHRLNCTKIDIGTMRTLSTKLRKWNWECQATVRNEEVIAVDSFPSGQLGLAIDLGTTKIAGYLVDLDNGHTLASKGTINPQIVYGEDVISRITSAVRSQEKGRKLQRLAIEEVNNLAVELCAEINATVEEIVEAVVVGNTAMHHLFLGLPVRQLALSPFIPSVSSALDVKARDLRLNFAPGAYVHLLPNIAGFVGADHVAMLLAIKAWRSEGPIIALDIGTNTEISLVNNKKITAVSCASGPVFEGGHIKDGMRASTGAIERLRIVNNSIQYQTIDDAPPVGICGSGVLDALSQLYLAGIINESGRIMNNYPCIGIFKEENEFVLVDKKEQGGRQAITITQRDVRELQLAKASIRSGIQVLLEANGLSEGEIMQVIIAGAFGTYIDVASAVEVGMFPSLGIDCFHQVGNAAGMGAKLSLISLNKRVEAQAIASSANYIELASAHDFNQTFMQASYLGRYRIKNGRREKIN